ncbi:MAG: hypothetical protein JXR37_25320 [Kiritimatiellae bacterium]|nr:hypothetical protein [Kiritimatiellia bacterium]
MRLATLIAQAEARFDRIARSHFLVAALCLLLVAVALNGLGHSPDVSYRVVAHDPFSRMSPKVKNNYHQTSPLLPLLGHYAHLTSKRRFFALCLALTGGGFAAFCLAARKRLGPEPALLLFVLLLAHPVTTVLLSWLGMPDCLTFLFTALLLFARSYGLVAVLSCLGAWNHPVFYFAAPVLLLLRKLAGEEAITWRHIPVCCLGLLAGWATVAWFLHANEITVAGRVDYLKPFLKGRPAMNLQHLPLRLFSLHGLVWFGLIAAAATLFARGRVYFAALCLAHLLFGAVTFFMADTTRVFSLLAWAPALHAVGHALKLAGASDERARGDLHAALLLVALCGVVVPRVFLVSVKIYTAPFWGGM